MLESDARLWATLINVAAIVGMVFTAGVLSIAGVLVIWLIYRERSALVDFHGKQQVNAAITLLIVGVASGIGIIITFGLGAIVLLPLLIAYGIFLLIITILAAVGANRGEYYRIPLIFRFVK